MDQVCALNCTVLGSNPQMRPVHYQEVHSRPLKYARDYFFPFDSLGAVPENSCTDIRGVRFTECPVYRGTTVIEHQT